MSVENQSGSECGTEQTVGCPCDCHVAGAASCPGCTHMHGGKGADPVEMAMTMWHKAFFKAHTELQTEKLKKRIEAAWGPVMDKAADAVIEAMGKHWQAMLQQAGAEQELREKLTRIFGEGQKQK